MVLTMMDLKQWQSHQSLHSQIQTVRDLCICLHSEVSRERTPVKDFPPHKNLTRLSHCGLSKNSSVNKRRRKNLSQAGPKQLSPKCSKLQGRQKGCNTGGQIMHPQQKHSSSKCGECAFQESARCTPGRFTLRRLNKENAVAMTAPRASPAAWRGCEDELESASLPLLARVLSPSGKDRISVPRSRKKNTITSSPGQP